MSYLTTLVAFAALIGPAVAGEPAVPRPTHSERAAARRALGELGPLAPLHAAALAVAADPGVRAEAARVLGTAVGDARCEVPLVRLALDSDPEVAFVAMQAWARRADYAYPRLLALAERPLEGLDEHSLRELAARLRHPLIEQIMGRSFTAKGNACYFAGQFDALRPHREACLPVLAAMFSNPDLRSVDPTRLPPRWLSMRLLAGRALGELGAGQGEVRRVLTAVANAPQAAVRDTRFHDAFRELAWAALYRLGDKEPLRVHAEDLVTRVERAQRFGMASYTVYYLGELAGTYHVMGDYPRAVAHFRRALAIDGQASGIHYNLACTLCQLKRPDEAIEHLVRAIELGFEDHEMVEIDGELTAARGHPAFSQVRAHPMWRGPR